MSASCITPRAQRGTQIANGQITPPDTPTTPAACTFSTSRSPNVPGPSLDAPCHDFSTGQLQTSTPTLPAVYPYTSGTPYAKLQIGSRFAEGQWSMVCEAQLEPLHAHATGHGQDSREIYVAKIARSKRAVGILQHESRILSYIKEKPRAVEYVVEFYGWNADHNALVLEMAQFSFEDYVHRLELLPTTKRDDVARRELLPMAQRLVQGLQWLHANSIVHGDIKPGNILIRKTSSQCYQSVYCDFSAARLNDPSTPPPKDSAGTYDFMAPEQFCLRQPGNWPSTASDVWALSVTLLYGVIGGSPYARATNVFARRAMASSGMVLEGLSMDERWLRRVENLSFRKWIEGAMEKRVDKRWSATEWAERVRDWTMELE